MKKMAICFSDRGREIIEKLNKSFAERGLEGMEAYIDRASEEEVPGFHTVRESVDVWTKKHFSPGSALIFVGAAGIAVRALSGLPADKLVDGPVLVIDDSGTFVIPLLSGHAGGANKLAVILADFLEAVPVITTSTDVHAAFSADTFAVENRLTITDRKALKTVSAKALEGKKVTLSVKNYPPKEPVDILVADETDAAYTLLLKPKPVTVGMGMKRDKDPAALEAFFLEVLQENGLAPEDVYALCTLDLKEEEPALLFLRDRYRIPVISFDAELLMKAEGSFSASSFVQETVGVDNVCERAAVLGAGAGAQLLVKKTARDGMTLAIAKRKV